ncbi:FKBP-type peptidyl-prolyl cis-trans isomerase [Aliagarivorans taiwanensis]|uniref:FKBP-type peptidyl-prolyl cis-trans isomerase n=1 Tax=Aliagarivorans taiwanensis TaxID=561966 RepID=UPI0003FE4040
MAITQNTVVTMNYTVKANGEQLDTTAGKAPLAVLIGHMQLVPGLEAALIGKQAGDAFALELEPADAYGERNDNLVQAVPLSMFGEIEVEAGMQFRATTEEGEQSVMVIAVEGDDVIVDGNHPLAGVGLAFDVEIVETREATEEEIAHGHAHQPSSSCCGGNGGCGSHDKGDDHECCGGKGHEDDDHECCGGKGH